LVVLGEIYCPALFGLNLGSWLNLGGAANPPPNGTDAKGKPMDINALWADTYVKMPNGTWQCVLSQGSDLKK